MIRVIRGMRLLPVVLACLLTFAGDVVAADDARFSLPLDGYYRRGRCIPVRIEQGEALRLEADGAVATIVQPRSAGVVPLLLLDGSPTLLRDKSLRPLADDERLVGIVSGGAAVAASLFPGVKLVPIPLDPFDPLPGPALAWEALDAVVLDRTIPPSRVAELLAAGITLVVRSSSVPDSTWNWQRRGEFWILQADLVAPTESLYSDTTYLPAASWRPSQSASARGRIVYAGVLVSLAALSTLLTRRFAAGVAVLLAVSCIISIELWRRSRATIDVAQGSILTLHPRHLQNDHWRYFAASAPSSGRVGVDEAGRPVPLSREHADRIKLTLIVAADGSLHWSFELQPRHRLAFLQRKVVPPVEIPVAHSTVLSPLRELARRIYLKPGARIVGESAAREDGGWSDVLIDAAQPTL